MDVIEDRGDTFDLVRQGMIGVSETVSGLKNYPVTIACKTGTPQRSETYYVGSTRKHYTNTMMIAYGPAEDAEIALGIVIEYGGGGARAGNLVADIFDAYYAMKDGSLTLDETGAGETADTTADGQDAVPETVENNDALAGDTAPAEQPAEEVPAEAPAAPAAPAPVQGGVFKLHIGEGKDINLEIPVGIMGEQHSGTCGNTCTGRTGST